MKTNWISLMILLLNEDDFYSFKRSENFNFIFFTKSTIHSSTKLQSLFLIKSFLTRNHLSTYIISRFISVFIFRSIYALLLKRTMRFRQNDEYQFNDNGRKSLRALRATRFDELRH